jgi:hypothetical protein
MRDIVDAIQIAVVVLVVHVLPFSFDYLERIFAKEKFHA